MRTILSRLWEVTQQFPLSFHVAFSLQSLRACLFLRCFCRALPRSMIRSGRGAVRDGERLEKIAMAADLLDEFSREKIICGWPTSGVCGLRTISWRERKYARGWPRGRARDGDRDWRERILWSTLVDESERGGGTAEEMQRAEERPTKTKRRTAGQASTSGFINSG